MNIKKMKYKISQNIAYDTFVLSGAIRSIRVIY